MEVYKLVSSKLDVMTDSSELYTLIPVSLTLTFDQSHSESGVAFSVKVMWLFQWLMIYEKYG